MKMNRSLLLAGMITAAGFGLGAVNAPVYAAEEQPEPAEASVTEAELSTAVSEEPEAAKSEAGVSAAVAAETFVYETTPVSEAAPVGAEAADKAEANENKASEVLCPDTTEAEKTETLSEEAGSKADKTLSPDEEAESEKSEEKPETSVETAAQVNSSLNGWSGTKYLQNGLAVKNQFQTIAGQTYYFNAEGNRVTGQKLIDGDYYCFDLNTGAMKKGITYLSEEYNSKRNGGAKTVYYDKETGKMRHGQKLIDDDYYCFDINSGAMKTGFTWLGIEYEPFHPKVVYYNEDGKMMHGQKKIDGEWYCFDINSGERKTGLTWLGIEYEPFHPKAVFYDEKGRMRKGIQQFDGKTYAFDVNSGERKIGLTWLGVEYDKDNPRAVYFNEKGVMQYGLQKIDGKQYCFDLKDGGRKTGITTLTKEYDAKNPRIVYFDAKGVMQTGVIKVGDKTHVFEHSTGAMKSGFLKLNESYGYKAGSVVYCDEKGDMKFGEQKIDKYWYCFDLKDGVMKTGFVKLTKEYTKNPKTVYYDKNGRMLYGDQTINGKKYYFDPVTGAQTTKPSSSTNSNGGTKNPGTTTTRPVAKNVNYRTDASGRVVEATNKNVTVMSQTDSRWAYDTINGYTVASTGCCATVMTMVINALNGTNYSIAQIGQQAANAGYMNSSYLGMGGNGINYLANRHGLTVQKNLSASQVKDIINRGGLVTCGLGAGPFVQSSNPSASHEILIYGYNGNNSKVIDPYGGYMSGEWSTSYIFSMPSPDRDDRANGGPFFGIYKA